MNIDVFFPSMNYMTWIVVASFKAMSECKLYYLLSIFESPHKKWENTKTNKSKKIQNDNNK